MSGYPIVSDALISQSPLGSPEEDDDRGAVIFDEFGNPVGSGGPFGGAGFGAGGLGGVGGASGGPAGLFGLAAIGGIVAAVAGGNNNARTPSNVPSATNGGL